MPANSACLRTGSRISLLFAATVLAAWLACGQAVAGEGAPAAPAPAKPAAEAAKPPPPPPPPFAKLFAIDELAEAQRVALLARLADHVVFALNYEPDPTPAAQTKLGRHTAVLEAQRFTRTVEKARLTIELGVKAIGPKHAQLIAFAAAREKDVDEPSPDAPALYEAAAAMVAKALAAAKPAPAKKELAYEFVSLSYVQTDRAVGLLKALGYDAIEYEVAKGENPIDAVYKPLSTGERKLPFIVKIADAPKTTLVTNDTTPAGLSGVSLPRTSGQVMDAVTSAEPQQRLLLVYDKAEPAAYRDLLMLLRNTIDIPARQVLIEAMVIEVRTDKLHDIGIELESIKRSGDNVMELDFGRRTPARLFSVTFDDALSGLPPSHFRAALNILLRDGSAEILSKPSVVALNNRQARIQVGQEIPISKAVTTQVSETVSVDYFHVGIVLNIKPRVSQDEKEVSMQIETIVSDVAASGVRAPTTSSVEVAPVIDTRHVQTFARVTNGTPFIIGGLIAQDRTETIDRIPLLGNLPYIGRLFRRESTSVAKSEVIVVLTPHIVPATLRNFSYLMPKDSDRFDSIGNALFRNAYRIRSTDVFDLRFLDESTPVRTLRAEATKAIAADPTLDDTPEIEAFTKGFLPGEGVFVRRMLYEILQRLTLERHLATENLIFFMSTSAEKGTIRVERIAPLWKVNKGMTRGERRERADTALVLSFPASAADTNGHGPRLGLNPVPVVSSTRIKDADTYDDQLLDYNETQARPTIILRDEADMARLKLCLLLKEAIALNGSYMKFTLADFHVGRQIVLPNPEDNPHKQYVVDPEAARLFYQSRFYYRAFDRALSEGLAALRKLLPAAR